jgi:hypothetical protein
MVIRKIADFPSPTPPTETPGHEPPQVQSTQRAGLPSDNPTASYWLRDPSPVLLGHRSTPELPAAADVAIVGSGITGAFAARFLKEYHGRAKHDSSVVMLEAREACSGATGRVSLVFLIYMCGWVGGLGFLDWRRVEERKWRKKWKGVNNTGGKEAVWADGTVIINRMEGIANRWYMALHRPWRRLSWRCSTFLSGWCERRGWSVTGMSFLSGSVSCALLCWRASFQGVG